MNNHESATLDAKCDNPTNSDLCTQVTATGRSACAVNGTLAVWPKKGDALLFWDMMPDGQTVDRRSLHASCPTLKGTKWTATK